MIVMFIIFLRPIFQSSEHSPDFNHLACKAVLHFPSENNTFFSLNLSLIIPISLVVDFSFIAIYQITKYTRIVKLFNPFTISDCSAY